MGKKGKGKKVDFLTTPEALAPFDMQVRDIVDTPLGVQATVVGVKDGALWVQWKGGIVTPASPAPTRAKTKSELETYGYARRPQSAHIQRSIDERLQVCHARLASSEFCVASDTRRAIFPSSARAAASRAPPTGLHSRKRHPSRSPLACTERISGQALRHASAQDSSHQAAARSEWDHRLACVRCVCCRPDQAARDRSVTRQSQLHVHYGADVHVDVGPVGNLRVSKYEDRVRVGCTAISRLPNKTFAPAKRPGEIGISYVSRESAALPCSPAACAGSCAELHPPRLGRPLVVPLDALASRLAASRSRPLAVEGGQQVGPGAII